MLRRKFAYPEDPVFDCYLLFGQEFIDKFRPDGLGYMQINDEPPVTFTEIICDLCNAEVNRLDPCLLVRSYLYCWDCAKDKLQYIT